MVGTKVLPCPRGGREKGKRGPQEQSLFSPCPFRGPGGRVLAVQLSDAWSLAHQPGSDFCLPLPLCVPLQLITHLRPHLSSHSRRLVCLPHPQEHNRPPTLGRQAPLPLYHVSLPLEPTCLSPKPASSGHSYLKPPPPSFPNSGHLCFLLLHPAKPGCLPPISPKGITLFSIWVSLLFPFSPPACRVSFPSSAQTFPSPGSLPC